MPTIHDVAKAAGVSISTVSYALSGKRPIGEETRKRIDVAVNELGYRAHAGARALAGEKTGLIALSSPMHRSTYAPAHMAFTLAVTTVARSFDYDIVLLVQDDATSGLRRMVSSRLVDGIIALDVEAVDERADLIRSLGVPAVFVGLPENRDGLTCVDLDFAEAARVSVDRLVAFGHREVAFVGHPRRSYDGVSNFPPRFRDSLHASVNARGIGLVECLPEQGMSGESILQELRAQSPGFSAIIFHCDDPMKIAVVEALADRGYRIPEDISVISACSTEVPGIPYAQIDTIPLPAHVTSGRGVELLLEELGTQRIPRVELIPPTYEDRGTVAAARIRP